jgi:O-antigen/teichoic acid export membrane protein
MYVTVGTGLVGIFINTVAVYLWGLYGAVGGLVIGSLFFLFSWIALANIYYRIPISVPRILVTLLICSAGYLYGNLMGDSGQQSILDIFRAVTAIGTTYFLSFIVMTFNFKRHIKWAL